LAELSACAQFSQDAQATAGQLLPESASSSTQHSGKKSSESRHHLTASFEANVEFAQLPESLLKQ
jgi:hypothetical protein